MCIQPYNQMNVVLPQISYGFFCQKELGKSKDTPPRVTPGFHGSKEQFQYVAKKMFHRKNQAIKSN